MVAVVSAGVVVELANDAEDDCDSVELSVETFADLDNGTRVLAYPETEPPLLILGLRGIDVDSRLAFIEGALREAFLDSRAGDPQGWQALIAALGDEGLNYDVARLRALPFAIEPGWRLRALVD